MQLALVRGYATTTVRHESLAGQKLLIVSQLDVNSQPSGDPMIVIDHHGAGKGEIVLLSSDGQGVRELIGSNTTPVRWYTLGIVDPVATPTL